MNDNELWEAIAAPLDPRQIKTRVQGKTTIRYISREDVIYRLNQVCPGEWEFRTELVATPSTGNMWVVKGILTIRGVTHEDYGIPNNDEHFDPPKAAVSDALKRCASQFGFALELYGDEPAVSGNAPKPTKKTGAGPKDAASIARPYAPGVLIRGLRNKAKSGDQTPLTEAEAKGLAIDLKSVFASTDARHMFYLTVFNVATGKNMTCGMRDALLEWKKDLRMAQDEARTLLEQFSGEEGAA